MSATPHAVLKSFLESQDVPSLVAVLLELADDHDAVRKRLARLQLAAKPGQAAIDRKQALLTSVLAQTLGIFPKERANAH